MKWLALGLGALLVAAMVSPAPVWADALPDCAALDSAAQGAATDCRTVSTDRLGLVFDGRDELLIITGSGGTGGDSMAVWRATADSTTFRAAGDMFGFRKFWKTTDGFIAQYAHSGAAAGSVNLYEFVDDALVTVAVLDVQTLDWPDVPTRHQWVINGGTKCALSTADYPPGSQAGRTQALRDAEIDPGTAQQRFCSEPWVANFYR